MKHRNWIEEAVGKKWCFSPVWIGTRGGRKVYSINWTDGTSGDYYINFDKHEIEEV